MATWSRYNGGTSETPLTLQGRWNGTTVTPLTFDQVVGTAPSRKTLLGMDAPNGTEWSNAVSNYPGIKYTRDFGTPTNLTPFGTGKWGPNPAGSTMHLSWKGDVEQLSTWMNGLTVGVYLSWYHEPMGDVSPTTFRATSQRMAEIINAHAKKNFVLGNGPIVTRYWLDELDGDPADWGYPGMTHYGIDCYQNTPTASTYYTNSKMFAVPFDKVHATYPGIKLWVPEWGITRLNSDTSGNGRAAAIESQWNYLKSRSDVDAVAYFNSSAFPQYAITTTSPEGVKFKALLAAQ